MSKIEYAGIVKMMQDEVQNINIFLKECRGVPHNIIISSHNCFCYGKELENFSLEKKQEKKPVKFSDADKNNIIGIIHEESSFNEFYKIELIKKICEL